MVSKIEKDRRRYELIQSIDYKSRSGSKAGYAKCWKKTRYNHWRVLTDIVWKLVNQDFEVYTEAEFKKGRGDIVAISPGGHGYIIEVLDSESDKRFSEKKNYYPEDFELVKVRTNDFKIEEWDL